VYTVASERGETGKFSPLPFTRGGLGRGKNLLNKGANVAIISIVNK
jgi:hypothetical protein